MDQLVGQWIPLMDYAMKKGISLSTLRRQIKSKKVPFRLENGRYLILDSGADASPTPRPTAQNTDRVALMPSQQKLELLNAELKKAQEEIAELKTLIAFYEESMFKSRVDV